MGDRVRRSLGWGSAEVRALQRPSATFPFAIRSHRIIAKLHPGVGAGANDLAGL
jgi:hypothetical protein